MQQHAVRAIGYGVVYTRPRRTDLPRHEPARNRTRAERRVKLRRQPGSRRDTGANRGNAHTHCACALPRCREREMTAYDRCESAFSSSEPGGRRSRTRTATPVGAKPDREFDRGRVEPKTGPREREGRRRDGNGHQQHHQRSLIGRRQLHRECAWGLNRTPAQEE